jgi:putative oxidoreductase
MANAKTWFQPKAFPAIPSAALLLLRLVIGAAFILHGWGKIQNPFGWMGPEAAVPGFLQFLAAFSEFGGGLAWILGFLTPLASIGIFFTMSVAVFTHLAVLKDPFVSATGGRSYELGLVYWCASILFLAMGPGRLSLDDKFFGARGSR